jgi:hypothetical protein
MTTVAAVLGGVVALGHLLALSAVQGQGGAGARALAGLDAAAADIRRFQSVDRVTPRERSASR